MGDTAVGERRVRGMRFLGLKKDLEGLWGFGLGVDPGASLGSVGMSVGSSKGGRTKELSGSRVVRGEISPECVPARLLFLTLSVFFRRPKGSRFFVRGSLLCTSVENLSFFAVAGLGGSAGLVLPRNLGMIDLGLVGCFEVSALFFGVKSKEGVGIAKGNCLVFFFLGCAAGEPMLGFDEAGPSLKTGTPGSSETTAPSCQLGGNIKWLDRSGASW